MGSRCDAPLHIIREVRSRILGAILSPRTHALLHRTLLCLSSLSSSAPLCVASLIPVLTDIIPYALTHENNTAPSRRAFAITRSVHGKRGWMKTDAERNADNFVNTLLLLAMATSIIGRGCAQRATSLACVRLSLVLPHASWRVPACQRAVAMLTDLLEFEPLLSSM